MARISQIAFILMELNNPNCNNLSGSLRVV